MMKWIFSILILLSVVFGTLNSRISEVSFAALNSGTKAVELTLSLMGSMAMWGGIMRVAEKSGITDKMASVFYLIISPLFKGIKRSGLAFKYITMNLTANLLGLGNAATPLGILAIKHLTDEESSHNTSTPSRNMAIFVIMNTASLQILPTTIATLRLNHGSKSPLDILPGIIITALISLTVGLIMVYTLYGAKKK